MKFVLALLFMVPLAQAQVWELNKGSLKFELDHTLKHVSGETKELKGKIQCTGKECEFLMAAEVKSFTTNDSNRDENMFQVTEATKYPYTVARGKVLLEDLLNPKKVSVPVEVDFHGKKSQYTATIDVKKDGLMSGDFTLLLENHGVERPGLFGMKIKNEVPMHIEMQFVKK